MKIQIWEMCLYYNICERLCNKYEKVIEFHIPELGYSFNYYEDKVNIIEPTADRYYNVNFFFEIVRPIMIREYEMNKDEEQMFKRLITKID